VLVTDGFTCHHYSPLFIHFSASVSYQLYRQLQQLITRTDNNHMIQLTCLSVAIGDSLSMASYCRAMSPYHKDKIMHQSSCNTAPCRALTLSGGQQSAHLAGKNLLQLSPKFPSEPNLEQIHRIRMFKITERPPCLCI